MVFTFENFVLYTWKHFGVVSDSDCAKSGSRFILCRLILIHNRFVLAGEISSYFAYYGKHPVCSGFNAD